MRSWGLRVAGTALAVALLAGPAVAAPQARAAGPEEAPADPPHYALQVTLEPGSGEIRVRARVTLPENGRREFRLSRALTLTRAEPPAEFVEPEDAGPAGAGRPWRYRLLRPAREVVLEYRGRLDFGFSDPRDESTRGFRSTRGVVSPEGVFLAGQSHWYPSFGDGLLTFELQANAPEGWHLVSQGEGTSRDASGTARWSTRQPMEQIYLVGGPLRRYARPAGDVQALAYLRGADPALAERYLQATARYLELYGGLVGPYPYAKFALVENFWETGFGMPSFTLLGPRVIRFPFILTSSYPHEILHNWWGNSVFVDYASGNWAEGLTAYLADHLLKAQQGRGAEYRRDALQKYRSYVRRQRDFPLTEFRSRHSAATQAVGYGRTMMGFHMLRRWLGDDAFRRWVRRFYAEHRGRRASFSDIRRSMEAASGLELGGFFQDWVQRPGAAELALAAVNVAEAAGGWEVTGRLRQGQDEAPYLLRVPVVVQTQEGAVETTVPMDGRDADFRLEASSRPLAVHVDPRFDLFRRLDPRELPPSLGQIFGEARVLAVLPAGADAGEVGAYRALAEAWRSEAHQPEPASAAHLAELPPDRSAWLLGRDNPLARQLFAGVDGYQVGVGQVSLGEATLAAENHAFVLVRRHPANPDKAVAWIFADDPAALPALGRKLPHYGRYSYLAFRGPEAGNVLKGQRLARESPLTLDLRPPDQVGKPLAELDLPPREPLARLPGPPDGS